MRTRFRLLTISALAGVGVFALAAPALAHVEVSADKTTAGATDVTLKFSGEAENPAGGIQSERVVLPTGITPSSVTLVKAPAGWKFSTGADGFTVAGKALKIGTDAVWSVKIAKLPDGQDTLNFKTLETYGNGDVSRWIEIQEPGQAEPDNPAPQLKLTGGSAAPSADSSAPADVTPSDTAVAPAATTPAAAAPASSDGGSSTWWIWVIVIVVVVAAGGFLFLRRRRPGA